MICTMCGQDRPLVNQGLCQECADKFKGLDAATATLQKSIETAFDQSLSLTTGFDGSTSSTAAVSAPEAVVSRVIGEFGQSAEFQLHHPFSVALDGLGRIMVLDRPQKGVYRVSMFTSEGTYLRTLLQSEQGSGPNQLSFPKGIASDAHGNIFIPDAGNNRIQRFDVQGNSLGPIGSEGDGPNQFSYPCDVEIDDNGLLYVADTANNRIQKLTPQGVLLCSIGGVAEPLDEPQAVAVDRDGNIFLADTNNHRLLKYDAQGKRLLAFGTEGTANGELSYPSDVRVRDDGIIYVADKENSRVQQFSSNGEFLVSFSLEQNDTAAGVGGDFAVDADGYVFVCNASTHRLTRVELFNPAAPLKGKNR